MSDDPFIIARRGRREKLAKVSRQFPSWQDSIKGYDLSRLREVRHSASKGKKHLGKQKLTSAEAAREGRDLRPGKYLLDRLFSSGGENVLGKSGFTRGWSGGGGDWSGYYSHPQGCRFRKKEKDRAFHLLLKKDPLQQKGKNPIGPDSGRGREGGGDSRETHLLTV